MPKLKTHKALMKRIKITGRGKVKWKRAFSGHLMSHKTGDKVQKLRQMRTAKAADIKRLKKMLHMQLVRGDAAKQPRPNKDAETTGASE